MEKLDAATMLSTDNRFPSAHETWQEVADHSLVKDDVPQPVEETPQTS